VILIHDPFAIVHGALEIESSLSFSSAYSLPLSILTGAAAARIERCVAPVGRTSVVDFLELLKLLGLCLCSSSSRVIGFEM
jgi:hypothetical protein